MLPLAAATFFMVSGGPYGIEDILGGAGYLKALAILAILPFLWSFPTALMMGELTSAIPCEGGFYVWVRRALGPFWGYQEAWLSLSASIFDMAIYPTLFVLYLSKVYPAWTAGWRGTAWELALIAACCLWNLRGAPAVGRGSIVLLVVLLAPFGVLVGLAFWHGWHLTSDPAWKSHSPTEAGLSTAIIVALWNYMGWDNASTIAQEVENPQRQYVRAVFLSAIAVAVIYIVPLLAMGYSGFTIKEFSTGSWADAATALGGPHLGRIIALGGTLTGLGMFNSLMMSYTRLPVVLAEDGMLPAFMMRRNRYGVPWVAMIFCAVAWAMALQFSFERLISIDLVLYGGSLILEFVALVVLRLREPGLERPFRAGNLPTAICLGLMPTMLIVYAAVSSRDEKVGKISALLFAGLVALAGPVFYSISRRLWAPPSAPQELEATSSGD
ncbi:APC family permease [Silvibacterium acidisoli]|uniref:APC family permease n=1 Tax=Acidobacteriaceae bacterium ZG23-2 TaxID=2883246 RepID=UPI00406CFA75